eukprot:4428095-Amphidinium_carterae.1
MPSTDQFDKEDQQKYRALNASELMVANHNAMLDDLKELVSVPPGSRMEPISVVLAKRMVACRGATPAFTESHKRSLQTAEGLVSNMT